MRTGEHSVKSIRVAASWPLDLFDVLQDHVVQCHLLTEQQYVSEHCLHSSPPLKTLHESKFPFVHR